MTQKTILIIGAGIAGLAAGCYGQMNGYKTRIFELHSAPGGLCTAWKRKGYTFDGCIHWLVGTGQKTAFHQVWEELGAVQGRKIVDHEVYLQVEGEGGRVFNVYTNVDRLEKHMLELAPADAGPIKELCGAIRRVNGIDMPVDSPNALSSVKMMIRALPMIGLYRKWGKMPVTAFTARISDPFLRQALISIADMPDFPMLAMIMMLGSMHSHNAGYPIGGSLEFSRAIERRYLALGGELNYNARVAKILVENDTAVGIRLADGSEQRGDIIISAADGHATIFDMLDGKYINDTIRGYYDKMPIFKGIVQVSLGVRRDLSGEPPMRSFILSRPIMVGGKPRQRLGARLFGFDPSMAPAGCSVITTMFESDHAYWKELAEEREHYDAEKQQVALDVIDRLETAYPGIGDAVEVVDVATPLTTERYTGNWQGSMEGWQINTHNIDMVAGGKGMAKTLPGLKNFYMAGQWVEPGGGIPTAALSGRKLLAMLCKLDKKKFVTSLP
jgi:phytoene dehydrogenase-like protein